MQTSEQDKTAQEQQALPLTDVAVAMLQRGRNLVTDIVNVAVLEARLVSLTITAIIVLVQITALLATACWLILNAAAYNWLVNMDYDSTYTLLGFATVNLVGALGTIFVILRLSRRIYFSATRKALGVTPRHEKLG